jgi:hypothetical protein
MNPHARTFKDLDTPLSRLGTRALIHPRSSFVYVPAVETDLRKTFADARAGIKRVRNEPRNLRRIAA